MISRRKSVLWGQTQSIRDAGVAKENHRRQKARPTQDVRQLSDLAKNKYLIKLDAPGDCICMAPRCKAQVEYRYEYYYRPTVGIPLAKRAFVCSTHIQYLISRYGAKIVSW